MRITHRPLVICALVLLPACREPTLLESPPAAALAVNGPDAIVARLAGDGYYTLPGNVNVRYAVIAALRADGSAEGQFRDYAPADGVDFRGRVTCMAVDPVNHRVWIGGVVTENRSTDPALQLDIHQPGQDVWFRALDEAPGSGAPDRRTFLGFRGGAGIITSPEYCAAQLWAAGNARTWPVTGGLRIVP